ncbi:hypothetical protein DV738_g2498, partial [Chaetothyriales sp. CBS 135597]
MRLLTFDERGMLKHTKDLITDIPPYAILSHRWGADEDEILFDDVAKGIDTSKAGYAKVKFCAEQSKKDGLEYFWVDTCCINRNDAVELSWAINSMFKWYRNAEKCYVFLSDVSKHPRNGHDTWAQFRNSSWFTRGWTLQELVAPSSVQFFSQEWEELGNKKSLEFQLHQITWIAIEVLQGSRPLADISVDERMSWADRRTTRHEEDIAYSLLGIFGVHMPLIYGEGEGNAFRRLEEEIEKASLLARGIQVTQSLVKFYVSSEDQDADVAQTVANLEHLSVILQSLSSALEDRIFRPDEQDLIKRIGSCVGQSENLIQQLKGEFEKFDEASASGFKSRNKTAAGRRVKYPFRLTTLQKLDGNINEIRDNISLALDVLALRDHKTIQDDVAETKSLVKAVRADQLSREIRDWLRAPDATINHQVASDKCHPGTGLWFVNGPIFAKWLTQGNSFLWVPGPAGSGKSVLCSTAIQHTFRQNRTDPNVGIAFFYFTFNDESKKDVSAMLRALLLQLSSQRADDFADLTRLHNSYRNSSPPTQVLIETLRDVIQKFRQVYILLDALDESPRYNQRGQVLDAIDTMRKWHISGLHLLVTSRDETDIRGSLNPTEDEAVILKNADVNQDISNFISERLNMDRTLAKWQGYHGKIQQALTERAQGVFRWVECQFDSLRWCPRSEDHLELCLRSLPEGLDETYERILCSIDKSLVQDARRILTLLCFSSRPLTLQELIDGIAVDLDEPAGLKIRRRLQDMDDIRDICPGLIDSSIPAKNETGLEVNRDTMNNSTITVRIAHFSVQEYLESDRIKLPVFALKSAAAHSEIAQICLLYLLEPELSSGSLDKVKLEQFPLAHFAALFWFHHYKKISNMEPKLDHLLWELMSMLMAEV